MTDTWRGLSAARNTVFSLLNGGKCGLDHGGAAHRVKALSRVPCMGYANDMVNVAQRKLE
jgi:hypothetical protein